MGRPPRADPELPGRIICSLGLEDLGVSQEELESDSGRRRSGFPCCSPTTEKLWKPYGSVNVHVWILQVQISVFQRQNIWFERYIFFQVLRTGSYRSERPAAVRRDKREGGFPLRPAGDKNNLEFYCAYSKIQQNHK